MRAGPLSNKEIMEKLNRYFVPVFVSNEDYEEGGSAPVAEREERNRVWREANEKGLSSGTVHAYVLAPGDGAVTDSLHVAQAAEVARTAAMLERAVARFAPAGGEPVVSPRSQAPIPAVELGGVALHLTARYLPPEEKEELEIAIDPGLGTSRNGSWSAYPAENWIVLSGDEVQKVFLPGSLALRDGDRWSWPAAVAERVLVHCYPSTECNDSARNRIESGELWSEVVERRGDTVVIRLGGHLRMRHAFYPGREDDNRVEAQFAGYAHVSLEEGRVRRLRLTTRSATYAGQRFGVAVESAREED